VRRKGRLQNSHPLARSEMGLKKVKPTYSTMHACQRIGAKRRLRPDRNQRGIAGSRVPLSSDLNSILIGAHLIKSYPARKPDAASEILSADKLTRVFTHVRVVRFGV
jgi:hypothetical protein